MMMTMTSFSVHHKLVGCFDSAMLWILELSVYTKMMYLSSCHLKETETSSSVVFGLVFNLASNLDVTSECCNEKSYDKYA